VIPWPVVALLATSSPAPMSSGVFERRIELEGQRRVAVWLDRPLYEFGRLDLGDLRVVDGRGRETPYILYRPQPAPELLWQPAIVNRSYEPRKSARATLDMGAPARKNALELSLSGDNFRRRVAVEASDDGEEWRLLVDDAWVFAVPDPPTRYETVRFPENDQRYLRVTVHHGSEDPDRIRIQAARVRQAAPEVPETVLRPRASVFQDAARRETQAVLDLGARNQPFSGVLLEVADSRFFRKVVVEARREPLPGLRSAGEGLRWARLAEGSIHRSPEAGERLRVDVRGRARVIRLRILNGDDAPLSISAARVAAPREGLVFEAAPEESYRLRYGELGLGPPAYDLAKSIGDVDAWVAAAVEARLGEPVPVAAGAPRPIPWNERYPGLLLAGLIAAVAGLGALTWRALQADM
jgi:Protein of unknown function (DUF3999)